MYNMMIHRGEYKDFDTIESCIDSMFENGFLARKVYFNENGAAFSHKITIGNGGNVSIWKKKIEK